MQIDPEKSYTFSDYRNWDDNNRWELLEGRAYAMSSPSTAHQILALQFVLRLGPLFSGNPCRLFMAPLDVKLSELDVVQPDLLVVCDPEQIRPTHVEGAPKLVIEILSPSSQRHDRLRKMNLYASAGVSEYWLVTPHPPMIEVHQNLGGLYARVGGYRESDVLTSPAFPEIGLDLAEIFASLPPQPPLDEVREGTPAYAHSNPI